MKEIIHKLIEIIKKNSSIKFRWGLLLLLINVPVGWIVGPLLGILFGWLFGVKKGGMVAGFFYVLSWIMLGLGALLAGKDGFQISRQFSRDFKNILLKKTKETGTTTGPE